MNIEGSCETCPIRAVSQGVNEVAHLVVARNLVRRRKMTLEDLDSDDGLSGVQVEAIGRCLMKVDEGSCPRTIEPGE